MTAWYVYRIDDISPDMNWEQFWRYLHLFKRHEVRPLLGVIPDSRDPRLAIQARDPRFWQILRDLKADGAVDISQHGYQHVYETRIPGLLGRKYGFKAQSEFAGLDYATQYRKILAGQQILQREGLATDIFMAPSHSFDRVTLHVLVDLGFRTLTDGVALFPYRRHGLLFVPQQVWRPRRLPLGVWTICLHINEPDERAYREVAEHLGSGARIVTFREAAAVRWGLSGSLGNSAFKCLYILNSLRKRSQTRLGARGR